MGQVKDEVRRYIEDNFIMGTRPKPVGDGESFLEGQVLDSTGFLELIAFLEEQYGIAVADEEMAPENLDSIDAIARYVARKRGA